MSKFFRSLSHSKFFAVVLAISLLSLGCGKKAATSKNVVLKFWKPFEDSQNIQPLIQAYQKAHPNVRIEYTKKNIETYEDDLLNALASGTGPDVFSVNNTWLPKYLDKVTPAPDGLIVYRDYKESFIDTVVQDFTRNQKIYGVALAVDSLGLYYNKDLLGTVGIATPPKTWDDLSQQVQRLTKQNKSGYFDRSGVAMGMSQNVNRATDILYLLMLQAGAQPWSKDGLSPTFNQSQSVNGSSVNPGTEALRFYTSFADPNDANYTWNFKSDYSIDSFANGRSAFLYSYAYTRQTIQEKAPNLNFDVATVPQHDLNGASVNFANYFGEVVNKQSPNADVAWDFLNFISSKDSLDKYYARHKQPSSRRDLIELQTSDPEIGVFAHANLTAKSFYKPDQVKFDTIISDMIDNVVLRGVDIGQALQQAATQARTLTQTRR